MGLHHYFLYSTYFNERRFSYYFRLFDSFSSDRIEPIGVVFQLAHVVESTDFHDAPVEGEKIIPTEWAIHQIRTTANFGTKSKVLNWYTGGLNFQVEHHLFPRISHVHYPAINKLVKETCEQFNIAYNEFPSMMAAMGSHTRHLKLIGRTA
ncbi:fatty acid desaturase [Marivirga tractuosa]|uniref:fatty acid desaturase n=1 Tax=Marivirga tractuosa TaxID=1006 RepID=UPI0035CFBA8E